MNKSNQTKTNRWVTENGVVVPRGMGRQEREMDAGGRLSAPVWKLHCGCEDSSMSTEIEIQCAHGSPVML